MNKIFLSSPHMTGNEMQYIDEAFETNWVAPLGKNVNEFEKEMAAYIGRPLAVALSSGSAAIHLGLKYLGVGKDDIVFCSSFTFSGSCNAIDYCMAKPVFIDSEYETYNMSPVALEKAYEKYPNPAAIIIVNLYGNPANYEELLKITKAHNTPVLEDSAESLGSKYKGIQTGNFGDVSIFSFNGNKIITTSGGGMAMINDKTAYDKILFWATQSREKFPWYQHEEIGYNYRLSNICAGIGRGQMTALDLRVKQKTHIYDLYKASFKNCKYIEMLPVPKDSEPNHWLTSITLTKDCKTHFMDIINALAERDIESRPAWKPMHTQPVFKDCDFFSAFDNVESFNGKIGEIIPERSVGEDLFSRSICLPSDSKMTDEQVQLVAKIVLKTIDNLNK
ncbi:MAG: aminotransferase class I/II-fold pyridoxal phosphate-dependent enzyme [Clostridia bacterium]